jgi:phosphatidylglycerophosphatase C
VRADIRLRPPVQWLDQCNSWKGVMMCPEAFAPKEASPVCGVAVFDFDKTLIRQGSLALFLVALIGKRRFVQACCRAAVRTMAVAPSRRRDVFRAALLRGTLTGVTLAQVDAAARAVFPHLLWRGEMLAAYARHRSAGHRVLVATGGLSCYMPTLLALKSLPVDGLLATEMAVDGDVLTGEMAAPSCTWTEKARRIKAWLPADAGEIWGYGNLPNDAAMLALTHHPTAVSRRAITALAPAAI